MATNSVSLLDMQKQMQDMMQAVNLLMENATKPSKPVPAPVQAPPVAAKPIVRQTIPATVQPTPRVAPTGQAMVDELERLRAENARLKSGGSKAHTGALTLKVSEKGAVSVYGIGRFPTTLYQEQWKKLLGAAQSILDFIEANQANLSSKE